MKYRFQIDVELPREKLDGELVAGIKDLLYEYGLEGDVTSIEFVECGCGKMIAQNPCPSCGRDYGCVNDN